MGAIPGRHLFVAVAVSVLLTACGSSPSTSENSDLEGKDASQLPTVPAPTQQPSFPNPSTPQGQRQFITTVFNDVQKMWAREFDDAGLSYRSARLVIFTSNVSTSCGEQSSEVGPFYCPADQSVYLDLRFFTALEQQFGVTGDFSQAYVVAHEMGHHVQNLLGISRRVAVADQRDPSQANSRSVRVELQADCLAGVWAHSTYERDLLEPGDLQEALTAAAAVGDDFLQQLASGQVEPENWTHGSSSQRQRWLRTGFDTGSPAACDTYSGAI